MRAPGRVVVPLKSMCSSTCDRPAPSQRPSWMLPVMHQACAETTGALWSSRTIRVRPFSRVVRRVPAGHRGISPPDFLEAARPRGTMDARIKNKIGETRISLSKTNSTRFRFDRRHRNLPRRQERFAERLVKIVAAFEIVTAVLLGLGQQPGFDHVENDFAEILAALNAPRFEHAQRHRTELLQCVVANAVEQFLAGNVANLVLGGR